MNMRMVWALCAALVLSVGVATATAGNSTNAKLCQKGGWTKLTDSTGTSFTSEDACVSYAAMGGVLTAKPKAQIDCESLHGTYSGATSTVIFTCTQWVANDLAGENAGDRLLGLDCGAYPNAGFSSNPDPRGQTAFPITFTDTCIRA